MIRRHFIALSITWQCQANFRMKFCPPKLSIRKTATNRIRKTATNRIRKTATKHEHKKNKRETEVYQTLTMKIPLCPTNDTKKLPS